MAHAMPRFGTIILGRGRFGAAGGALSQVTFDERAGLARERLRRFVSGVERAVLHGRVVFFQNVDQRDAAVLIVGDGEAHRIGCAVIRKVRATPAGVATVAQIALDLLRRLKRTGSMGVAGAAISIAQRQARLRAPAAGPQPPNGKEKRARHGGILTDWRLRV